MADDILPYGRQWIEEDDVEAVIEAVKGAYLTTGPTVARFEAALAEAVGAKHAVAVCNGTAALHAACVAAGLGPGDEVLVPALTFLATANCARYVGAEPIFVDVNPDSGLIDVEDAARRITSKTKAIIPVHLTGRPVELDAIAHLARAHGLIVIEDAAHALGARYHDEPIGACARSDMAIFSFHPVKHVTTGEGGAITTNDETLAEAMRVFRSHGMVRENLRHPSPGPWYYEQHTLGFNYRITDLQCALGISQMAKLPRFLARRRELAARYDKALVGLEHVRPVAEGPAEAPRTLRKINESLGTALPHDGFVARRSSTPGTLPPRASPSRRSSAPNDSFILRRVLSAYHLYSVLIDFAAAGIDRAAVMAGLREFGVLTQVHYIPIPAQPYYEDRGADMRRYPGAQAYYDRTLSLPLYPAMADADVDRVVAALREVLSRA